MLFHRSVQLTNPWLLPKLELPVTYICHGLLHNGLVGCVRRSYYASTWFSFSGDHLTCFVSTSPLIIDVHSMSQAEIGAPALLAFELFP